MNKELPLVSIITPSYNQGRFIEDTILSVKNQNYLNIEHIIVDGDSDDNTLEILKKYEGIYNMRWISEIDKGQSNAINKGIDLAKGKIIGWLNSDDTYFSINMINFVVESFRNHPEISMVYGDNAAIDQNNNLLYIRCGMPRFNYSWMKMRNFINQPTVFFRSSVIKKNKLVEELHFAMDYELWLRLGYRYRFLYIPKIIAAARYHQLSKIATQSQKVYLEDIKVKKEYASENLKKSLRNILLKYYFWFRQRLLILKGVLYLPRISNIPLAFNLQINNFIKVFFRQVFKIW